jgi:hypothetical protein
LPDACAIAAQRSPRSRGNPPRADTSSRGARQLIGSSGVYDEPAAARAAALRQSVVGPGHVRVQLLEPGHDSSRSILGFDGKLATWLATFDAVTYYRTAKNSGKPNKMRAFRVGLARFELATPRPPDIGGVSETVRGRPISLTDRVSDFGGFQRTNPNGGHKGGQTHS